MGNAVQVMQTHEQTTLLLSKEPSREVRDEGNIASLPSRRDGCQPIESKVDVKDENQDIFVYTPNPDNGTCFVSLLSSKAPAGCISRDGDFAWPDDVLVAIEGKLPYLSQHGGSLDCECLENAFLKLESAAKSIDHVSHAENDKNVKVGDLTANTVTEIDLVRSTLHEMNIRDTGISSPLFSENTDTESTLSVSPHVPVCDYGDNLKSPFKRFCCESAKKIEEEY